MKSIGIVCCIILLATSAYGQTGLATVTGTLTDTSGAVVANAPIELKNTENGAVFAAASSGTGNFTLSQVPVGDYDLVIAVPGFKKYEHKGFHLAAQQTMREDVALQVGATTDSVTVTAEASLLKTESSGIVNNVTLSQLNNLPVLTVAATNSGFRDPFASMRLIPGAQYAGGSNIGNGTAAAVTQLVVNGAPANTFQSRMDGLSNTPTGPRLIGAQMQTQPSVDAVQEVAIQTSNFAAEFGTAGGAVINMVSKSGTNQFHGSVYDYATNEALNARQPYTGNRNVVKQHDFGFTVGGPVRIPKIYDGLNRTFFFVSYEQFRAKVFGISNTTSVPLPAYRVGDFSGLLTAENRAVRTAAGDYTDPLGNVVRSGMIYDPLTQQNVGGIQTRSQFPGNRIPVSRFDPVTVKILPEIPLPLGSNSLSGQASNNYQGTFNSSRVSAIPSLKVDHNIGQKGRASFYYQNTHTEVPRTPTGVDPFNDTITASTSSKSSGHTIRLSYDYTATPRLLFHFGVGWNDSDFGLESPTTNYDAFKTLGLVGQTAAVYFPRLITGVNANTAIGGLTTLGPAGPTRSFERRPSGTVSGTYVLGNHSFKAGFELRKEKFPNVIRALTAGQYTFAQNYTQQPSLQGSTINQGFTGFEFASFLLGGTSAITLNAPIGIDNNKAQTALYVQDTWKVTRKLTLDYGLRWDYGTYASEHHGRNGSIGLAIPNPSASGRLGANQFEATCNCSFAKNYPWAFGPRLGAAYQLDSKTVLRVGLGIVYNATATNSGAQVNSAASSALPAGSGQINSLFKDGIPANIQAQAIWPSFNPGIGQAPGTVIAFPAMLDQNAGRPARMLQWNVGLQRTFGSNTSVEASYVGNRGVWWTAPTAPLTGSALPGLNVLSQATLRNLGFNNLTSLDESRLLTTNISALTAAQRTTLAARGVSLTPYANFPTSQTVRQALLQFPQYTGSGLQGAPLGKTWYDSFQLNVTQRFTKGLALNMNYVFAKTLDLMSSPDPFNRNLGKNYGPFDIPHQFRLTVQYVVPKTSGSGIPVLRNKWVSTLVSDWGIGAFLQYQSANVVQRPASAGNVPISQFLGYGPGNSSTAGNNAAQLKKNADGSYMSPWAVNWTDYSGKVHAEPLDINCACFDVTKTQVLNPNAWTNVPDGQFAADTTTLRSFRGFRNPTENVNLSRNFQIRERMSLNIRAEFNNIFNRMQYSQLINGANAGAIFLGNFAAAPTFQTGRNAGLYGGGFGVVVPTAGTFGNRTGTLVARFTF